MASWDEYELSPDKVAAPPGARTASPTAVEQARWLLKQLFAKRATDERPPPPKR